MAFYFMEPWGEERDDLRAGVIASTMNNRWRNKGEEPKKPSDYLLFKDEDEEPPSVEDLKLKMRAFGAGIRRRSGNTG